MGRGQCFVSPALVCCSCDGPIEGIPFNKVTMIFVYCSYFMPVENGSLCISSCIFSFRFVDIFVPRCRIHFPEKWWIGELIIICHISPFLYLVIYATKFWIPYHNPHSGRPAYLLGPSSHLGDL